MMSALYFWFTRVTYIYEINEELILLLSSNLDVYYSFHANIFIVWKKEF